MWYDDDVQAVTAMVQQAMKYIDEVPTVEGRIELIETLNTVSAGKVQLSLQYAIGYVFLWWSCIAFLLL